MPWCRGPCRDVSRFPHLPRLIRAQRRLLAGRGPWRRWLGGAFRGWAGRFRGPWCVSGTRRRSRCFPRCGSGALGGFRRSFGCGARCTCRHLGCCGSWSCAWCCLRCRPWSGLRCGSGGLGGRWCHERDLHRRRTGRSGQGNHFLLHRSPNKECQHANVEDDGDDGRFFEFRFHKFRLATSFGDDGQFLDPVELQFIDDSRGVAPLHPSVCFEGNHAVLRVAFS